MDNESKAQLLNDYFCSISSINDTNKQVSDVADRTDQVFDSLEVASDEIYDVIKILKLGKASGADSIRGHSPFG